MRPVPTGRAISSGDAAAGYDAGDHPAAVGDHGADDRELATTRTGDDTAGDHGAGGHDGDYRAGAPVLATRRAAGSPAARQARPARRVDPDRLPASGRSAGTATRRAGAAIRPDRDLHRCSRTGSTIRPAHRARRRPGPEPRAGHAGIHRARGAVGADAAHPVRGLPRSRGLPVAHPAATCQQFEADRRPYVLATNVIELGLQQAKVSPFPSVAELFGEPGYDTVRFRAAGLPARLRPARRLSRQAGHREYR